MPSETDLQQEQNSNESGFTTKKNLPLSPRVKLRFESRIQPKKEAIEKEQAEQAQQIAQQQQKRSELTKSAGELYQKIMLSQHNSKSTKTIAAEITEISAKFFQQMNVEQLTKMDEYQRNMLAIFEMPNSNNYIDKNIYTHFIKHLKAAVENNCKVMAEEGTKSVVSVSKEAAFEGLHFWHKVLTELQNNHDDFSVSVVLDILTKRRASLGTTEVNGKKASTEYGNKYPEDTAIFTKFYEAQRKIDGSLAKEEDLINYCIKPNNSIPASFLLNKIIDKYEKRKTDNNNGYNKDDVLTYQMHALQSSYFAYEMDNLKVKIDKYKNENDYKSLAPSLLEMRDIQSKALTTIDNRIETCNKLISQSDHTTLPIRYKELNNLLDLKLALIHEQKFNLSNMKLCNTNNKEPSNLPENSIINTDYIKPLVQKHSDLEKEKTMMSSDLTAIASIENITKKIEELRMVPYRDNKMTEDKLKGLYNDLMNEINAFAQSHIDDKKQHTSPSLQQALKNAVNTLSELTTNHFEHSIIKILARPDVMQTLIKQLEDERQNYEVNKTNINNKIMLNAIEWLKDTRFRLDYLFKVTNDPNFNVNTDIKTNLQNQLKSLQNLLTYHHQPATTPDITQQNKSSTNPEISHKNETSTKLDPLNTSTEQAPPQHTTPTHHR